MVLRHKLWSKSCRLWSIAGVALLCTLVLHQLLLEAPFQVEVGAHRSTTRRSNGSTIFISIVSYRDAECSKTLQQLYHRAVDPTRLRIGLVEQDRDSSHSSCLPQTGLEATQDAPWRSDQIRRVFLSHLEAKGPTHARFRASLLYRGEDYFLMIDAHMRFQTGWDQTLVDMHKKAVQRSTVTGKAVISHYPPPIGSALDFDRPQPATDSQHTSPMTERGVICRSRYLPELGYFRLVGDQIPLQPDAPLYPQPFAAAGFLFSSGNLVDEVPFDPYLDYLFDGEELLYSARMWTHGWDIFAPSEVVVLHNYDLSRTNEFLSTHRKKWVLQAPRAQERLRCLLGLNWSTCTPKIVTTVSNFSLGTKRSLEAYWKFAGVNQFIGQWRGNGAFRNKSLPDLEFVGECEFCKV
jgi:hypothetical protein